eukprot:RCo000450
MGNGLPAKPPDRLATELEGSTAFTRDEIMDLYLQFRFLSCGKSTIPRDVLGTYLEAMIPSAQSKVLRSVLAGFDHAGAAEVDFRQFCSCLATSTTDKLETALEVTFSMYNEAGESRITKEEMVQSLLGMQNLLSAPELFGEVPSELKTTEGTRKWVETVFLDADLDRDNALSFQEFREAVRQYPLLVQLAKSSISEGCRDIFQESSVRRRGSFRKKS